MALLLGVTPIAVAHDVPPSTVMIDIGRRSMDLELQLQLKAASDAYNQKLAQYKAGIINLVDLANASFELFSAQSDYISTLNEWYTASLDKAAASGQLDLFIQSVK